MLKTIKLLSISNITSSLTWLLVLCASMLLGVNSAEARRMNPALMNSVDSNQPKSQQATVAGIMCRDCTNTQSSDEAPSG